MCVVDERKSALSNKNYCDSVFEPMRLIWTSYRVTTVVFSIHTKLIEVVNKVFLTSLHWVALMNTPAQTALLCVGVST